MDVSEVGDGILQRKKDGVFLNVKLQRSIRERLDRFAEATGYSFTAIVEKALDRYLDAEEGSAGIFSGQDAGLFK